MSRPVPEPLVPDIGTERVARLVREDARSLQDANRSQSSGEAVVEGRLRDNVFLLAGGVHGGMRLTVDGTRVIGTGEAVVNRQVVIDGALIVLDGLTFESRQRDLRRNNRVVLVDISATSKAIFRGCTFRKSDVDEGSFVDIASGADVTFVGCVFLGGNEATNVVDNAGAAGDVQVAFGANTTGKLHVNCTITGEIL